MKSLKFSFILLILLASCRPIPEARMTVTSPPKSTSTSMAPVEPSATHPPEPSPTPDANAQIAAEFEKYGFELDPEKYQTSTGGVVTEVGTGEVVYADGKFEIHFVIDEVRNSGNLVTTPYAPKTGNVPENSNWATDQVGSEYLIPIIAIWRSEYKQIYGIDPYIKGNSSYTELMLNPSTLSWGAVWNQEENGEIVWQYLIFETKSGNITSIPLMKIPPAEIIAFWLD